MQLHRAARPCPAKVRVLEGGGDLPAVSQHFCRQRRQEIHTELKSLNSKGTNNPINKRTDELIDLKRNAIGNKYLKTWPSDECKSKPLFYAVRMAIIKRTVSSYLSQPRGFTHLRLSCHSEKGNSPPPISSPAGFPLHWPTSAPQPSFPTLPRKPPSLLRGCWSSGSLISITVSMTELSFLLCLLCLHTQLEWRHTGFESKGE